AQQFLPGGFGTNAHGTDETDSRDYDMTFRHRNTQHASLRGRPNVVVAVSRISSDSAESSTARERISAPTSPAIVARACFRRAATDWAGMKLRSASIKDSKPFVTARRTARGCRTTSEPTAAIRHPCARSLRCRG